MWSSRVSLGSVALAAVCLATAALSCTELESAPVFSPEGTTTKIILVRHAERDPGLDPPLNDEGLVRADALADELADEGVTAVFYPDLLRNRQTAAPLVEATNAAERVFSAVEIADTRALANTVVAEVIRDHAGGVVVWIGNTGPITETQSGNLQEIYNRLGGTGVPPTRYEAIYRITVFDDQVPEIEPGTYGGPSSLD